MGLRTRSWKRAPASTDSTASATRPTPRPAPSTRSIGDDGVVGGQARDLEFGLTHATPVADTHLDHVAEPHRDQHRKQARHDTLAARSALEDGSLEDQHGRDHGITQDHGDRRNCAGHHQHLPDLRTGAKGEGTGHSRAGGHQGGLRSDHRTRGQRRDAKPATPSRSPSGRCPHPSRPADGDRRDRGVSEPPRRSAHPRAGPGTPTTRACHPARPGRPSQSRLVSACSTARYATTAAPAARPTTAAAPSSRSTAPWPGPAPASVSLISPPSAA